MLDCCFYWPDKTEARIELLHEVVQGVVEEVVVEVVVVDVVVVEVVVVVVGIELL